MWKNLIITIIILLSFNKLISQDNPYFINNNYFYPTVTIGVIGTVYQQDMNDVYNFTNIGLSLLIIGDQRFGIYIDAKWGYTNKYNLGIGFAITNLFRVYLAAGTSSCYKPYFVPYYPNIAGGLMIITPFRIGAQIGFDYGIGLPSNLNGYDISLNIGINYSISVQNKLKIQ